MKKRLIALALVAFLSTTGWACGNDRPGNPGPGPHCNANGCVSPGNPGSLGLP